MTNTLTAPIKYPFAQRVEQVPVSFIRDILKSANQPDIVSFAGGLPNPNLFPVKGMAKAAAQVFKNDGTSAMQYSVTEGFYPLRQYISSRYRKSKRVDIPPENILITNGSQQALDLIGKVFINPGDHILVERPSYLGAIQSLSMYQPQFHEATLLEDGIDMEEFKTKFWEFPIKLFYCVPNYQNPTGVTYSTDKRLEIAKIVRKYSSIIVEDDPYGDIRFDEDQPDAIWSYNSDQVILLGSFSKTVAPGLRLGWMVAEPPVIEKLAKMKQASDLHSNLLSQYILYQFLMENDLNEHIRNVKSQYQKQKDQMVDFVRKYFPPSVKFINPKGGMFLWIILPNFLDANEVLKLSLKEKVIFVPGNNFYVTNGERNTLRLNFSNTEPLQMEVGIRKLGEILWEMGC